MLLVYGHLPGQVTETGSDAICPDNACRIRNGWQTPRGDSGDGTTRTGRTGGTGRTRSLYIIYILYAVNIDSPSRQKLGAGRAKPWSGRQRSLLPPVGVSPPPPKKKSNFFRLFPRTGDIQIEEIMLYYCHKVWLYEDGEDANEQDRATWRRF